MPGNDVECNMSVYTESKHTVLHNQSHSHSIVDVKYTVYSALVPVRFISDISSRSIFSILFFFFQ